jgi:beta-glucosidase
MEEKIEALIKRMTREEKATLTGGKDLWHSSPLERLGIPALKLSDGPNGVRGKADEIQPITSASFPVGSAMAATWNPSLIKEIGMALGEEAHAKGAQVLLGPTVNIHRVPLAGRNFECFSEDPYLSSVMAVSYIRGVQSQGVAACVKHFVCNDQETDRFSISAEIPDRVLHEIYLPPFKAAVIEAGVHTVMSAYNRVNGVFASEHRSLLLELLKDQWGFDGLVISDWYGTYSPAAAVNGCDLEMPGPPRWMGKTSLLAEPQPDEEILNDQVRRLLRTLYRTNAFKNQPGKEMAENRSAHRELIRKAGIEAIVLLKNMDDTLPLDPEDTQTIALIGQLADEVSFQGGGSSQVTPHYVVSPREALEHALSNQIHYAQGYDIRKQSPAIDPSWWINETGAEGPLSVTYFRNTGLAGEPFQQTSCLTSSLSWFGETMEHWDPKEFSVRMEGEFQPAETQEYTLVFSPMGRGRLWIDQELILDLWDDSSADHKAEIDLILEAQRTYALTIEYACDLDLRWRAVHLGILPTAKPDLFQEAIDLASKSDLALVVAGLNPEWETEGNDRESLALPGEQDRLIEEVAAVNPNTIVVLQTGSPVLMPWLDQVQAVIQAWYLGQESGNALAEVLIGAQDPGGRLPTTFPADIKDNPAFGNFPGRDGKVHYQEGIFVGYRHYDATGIKPLFPFGHGLSYTTFVYQNLELNLESYSGDDLIEISVEVTNIGTRPGWEVVQLYLHDKQSSLPRPPKELKGFQKILLQQGETRKISFELESADLAFYNDRLGYWVVEPGEFEILVGRSAGDILLTKNIHWK